MSSEAQRSGLLRLEFVKPEAGRAGLRRREQRFPLHMTSPLYIDPNQPDMAFVYVQNPSGAVFGGDRFELRVSAGPGAKVHVTTPSATKVNRSEGEIAVQEIDFQVGEGAVLEYIPEPLIPFAGSKYEQSLSIDVEKNAAAILAEVLAPGRLARGEEFGFDRLLLKTRVQVEGRDILRDTILLEPATQNLTGPGLFGGHKYLASLIVVVPGRSTAELAASLQRRLQTAPGVLGAASQLYGGAGLIVRMLGTGSIDLNQALFECWSEARRFVLGTLPPRRRK